MPVGHTTDYLVNLRDKLQHLPSLADADGQYLIQQTGQTMELVEYAPPTPTEVNSGWEQMPFSLAPGETQIVQLAVSPPVPFSKIISSEIEMTNAQGLDMALAAFISAYSAETSDSTLCNGVDFAVTNIGEESTLVDYIIRFRYWV